METSSQVSELPQKLTALHEQRDLLFVKDFNRPDRTTLYNFYTEQIELLTLEFIEKSPQEFLAYEKSRIERKRLLNIRLGEGVEEISGGHH